MTAGDREVLLLRWLVALELRHCWTENLLVVEGLAECLETFRRLVVESSPAVVGQFVRVVWDLLGKSGPGRAQVDSDRVVPRVVTWNALVAELLGVTQPDFRFKVFLLGERVINVRFSS